MKYFFSGLLMSALLAQPAISSISAQGNQDFVQPLADDTTNEIIVNGRDIGKATKEFVDNLDIPEFNRQYSRWDLPICLEMIGWQEKHAVGMTGLINDIVAKVGHDAAAENCRPNMAVVLTADPDAFLAELKDNSPQLYSRFTQDQRVEAEKPGQPVRILLGARVLNKDGREVHSEVATRPPPGLADLRAFSAKIVQGTGVGDSRIGTSIKYDFVSGVAIVDVNRIHGLTFKNLASYIAMRMMSGIPDDTAPADSSSILGLFKQTSEGSGYNVTMSEWDMAFLTALYRGSLDKRSSTSRHQIAKTMSEILTEE